MLQSRRESFPKESLMHRALGLIAAVVLLVSPLAGSLAYADLNDVAKALGAPS